MTPKTFSRRLFTKKSRMLLFFLQLLVFLFNAEAAGSLKTSASFIASSCHRSSRHGCSHTFLLAEKSNNTSKSARERGIYSRPSAAIERGSGFFIPGLEGPKIRLFFGLTVLLVDAASHVLAESMPGDVGQVVAESVAAFYGALLLLQGTIEMGAARGFSREIGVPTDMGDDLAISTKRRGAEISDALKSNEKCLKSIQRVAETIMSFTPATYVKLVDSDSGVLYSLSTSSDGSPAMDTNEQNRLISLALDAVSASRGGRVALPSEHPVSKLLPPSATRCILVQAVKGNGKGKSCVVLGSDSLLPSFTKNDLRWIGQLADTIK